MTTAADLAMISQNLVEGFFGSYLVLSVAVFSFFLITYLMNGVPFRVALATLAPLWAAFNAAGWLGSSGNTWILAVVSIVLALMATPILLRLYGGR